MLALAPLIAAMLTVPGASSQDVEQVVHDMTLPTMHVDVIYTECGQTNAMYFPAADALIVCTEDFALQPGALRFITAHEMGHAIIDQLSIPFTGSEEEAADEIAAVYSGMANRPEDTMEMAMYFLDMANVWVDPRDDHPPNEKRAWTLACMADGAEPQPVSPHCQALFDRATDHWKRLIVAGLLMKEQS